MRFGQISCRPGKIVECSRAASTAQYDVNERWHVHLIFKIMIQDLEERTSALIEALADALSTREDSNSLLAPAARKRPKSLRNRFQVGPGCLICHFNNRKVGSDYFYV